MRQNFQNRGARILKIGFFLSFLLVEFFGFGTMPAWASNCPVTINFDVNPKTAKITDTLTLSGYVSVTNPGSSDCSNPGLTTDSSGGNKQIQVKVFTTIFPGLGSFSDTILINLGPNQYLSPGANIPRQSFSYPFRPADYYQARNYDPFAATNYIIMAFAASAQSVNGSNFTTSGAVQVTLNKDATNGTSTGGPSNTCSIVIIDPTACTNSGGAWTNDSCVCPGTGSGTGAGTGNGAGTTDQLYNPLPEEDLTHAFLIILQGFLAIVGVWAVIFIVVGGFQMVMASGNEEMYAKAKKTITWAVLGLAIALLSFSIVAIVQNLLQANVKQVNTTQNGK